jgi:hypothetical protein
MTDDLPPMTESPEYGLSPMIGHLHIRHSRARAAHVIPVSAVGYLSFLVQVNETLLRQGL